MLPLHHSNRPNEAPQQNSLARKSSRPSMGCKELPYNGSASCYINAPPPYLERPPSAMDIRQRFPKRPTILSFHQPLHRSSDGPFLVPPPRSPALYRGGPPPRSPAFYHNGPKQGWQPPTASHLGFSGDPSAYGTTPTEYVPGANVSFYCERKKEKPNRKIFRRGFIILVLIALGVTVYNHGIENIHQQLSFGVSNLYHSYIEGKGLADWREDVDRGIDFVKNKVQSVIEKYPRELNFEPLNFVSESIDHIEREPIVILSINEDFESTVEVVDG